ncbi:cytochrome P450 [Penicillium diatomitis]|uniref:Cytochrome P450 n=1 Tax=Penicillium diatomitis TaxID=2819901 RepID=A0A9W9X735_9EURO|nr:cytochrome P450 [Penicillium diatomitis]KAJ5485673.1 cytochrome P450 [Penicillium diatomitis]
MLSPWTLIAIIVSLYYLKTYQEIVFPVVNAYAGDIFRRKAYREYKTNAKRLIAKGLAKYNGPISLLVPPWVVAALQHHWGDSDSWHQISWERDTTGIISWAAASVFVGPGKASDPEWQMLSQAYVRELFSAVSELHTWRPSLRSVVQWFLPHTSACQALARKARVMIDEVVERRAEESHLAQRQGRKARRYNDVLSWTSHMPSNKLHLGDIQLALAVAALFTTSEALRQTLTDLAEHPELVAPLRREIEELISRHGLCQAALQKMDMLDSLMKESQRQTPGLAIRDTTLPDETLIPRGSHIMVDSSDMWNPEVHDYPDVYDGYRFVKQRHAGDKASQFVQASREHNTFGGGRHICRGRFFANAELKICLAHILLDYVVRLKEGYCSKPMSSGVYDGVDSAAELEVRRRSGSECCPFYAFLHCSPTETPFGTFRSIEIEMVFS